MGLEKTVISEERCPVNSDASAIHYGVYSTTNLRPQYVIYTQFGFWAIFAKNSFLQTQ
jgi:hypothetical protein